MDRLRVIVHALIFLICAQVIEQYALRTGNPVITGFLGFMRWGCYVPFAVAAASALNHHRGMIILVMVLTVALGAPTTMRSLADQVAPIGRGVVQGAFITKLGNEPDKHNAKPTTRT